MVPSFPAVPASNVHKTCGQSWRLLDEPSLWVLLTVGEVAKLRRCSKATVYGMVEHEKLPSLRVSNAIRIRREDLEAYLLSRSGTQK
jgi:excisionase family DNA binding protein